MRTTLIIAFIISSSVWLDAREVIERILEPAILEVKYERRKVLDTLDVGNDFRQDILTLKVGKTVSAFYSSELKTVDSIEYRHHEIAMARYDNYESFKAVARLPKEKIFKNYPEGKVRVHDRFDFCHWMIDEDWEKPVWNITDSISMILGYECMRAETNFRGRHWVVWFTFDIPVSDGPWKLCGLPGLILQAQDSKGHYVYEPVSIRTKNVGNVEYYDYDAGNRLKITRERALPRKNKSLHEDLYFKIVSSGAYGIYNPNVKERKIIPHTNYDFEEIDYLHE